MDRTQPTSINPEENEETSDLDLTRPVSIEPEQAESTDAGQTVPVAIDLEDEPHPGLEATIPPASDTDPDISERQLPLAEDSGDIPEGLGGTPTPPLPDKKPFPVGWLVLIGVFSLVLIAAISTFGGYTSGIGLRKSAQSTQVAIAAQEQFELGLQDMEAKRYDLARQRFEYVIQLNPNYSGVTEMLAVVLLELNTTATPTPKPTPTITPTPDMRSVEELFAQAQQDLSNTDWTRAIDTLLALRKADPNYQAVWVDDMLYVAYRNRGKDKILRDGDLEGGIYDLTQAEQIGPLDADSKGYLTWSGLYITGASFWELDWGQAVYYFAQVAPALPNLRDGSGWTATERYRLALVGYGDFLAENGDWCSAQEQLELALSLGSDSEVEEALDFVAEKCAGDEDEDSDKPSESSEPPPTEPSSVEPTQPASEEPTEAPATEAPSTEAPSTEAPPTEVSPTEAAPTEAPPTEAAPTEAPTTEPPPAEEPSPTPGT